MKTTVIKRPVRIGKRKTSISLEKIFWDGLHEIALFKKTSVPALLEQINERHDRGNLSSAIRLFVYNHYRMRMDKSRKRRKS